MSWHALAAGAAFAQQNIGATAEAHNNVSHELSGAEGPLKAGDWCFATRPSAPARIRRPSSSSLIPTNLAIGPTSRVTLDQFVYAGEVNGQKMTVNLAKGIFRFTTGTLDKRAYTISTSTSVIGVRGTVLDIGVTAARTGVTLVEGMAIICARGGGGCVVLSQAGQTAQTRKTANGAITVGFISTPVNVGSLCSGSLCSGATYASLSSPGGGGGGGGFPSGALCGH